MLTLIKTLLIVLPLSAAEPVTEADYVIRDFTFASGERLPELRIHYRTLGAPHRDAMGHVDNAVLIMHGTGGSGAGFLVPHFAGELFGPGQVLDTTRYFVVTASRASQAMACAPTSRSTDTPTWWRRSIAYWSMA